MNTINLSPSTIFTGDNLDVLRGINSECIDLIYLDPPFNSNKNYSAPIGSEAAGAAFKDTWTLSDVDEAWIDMIEEAHPEIVSIIKAAGKCHSKGMQSFLIMMTIRLLEMHRILKDTGSIYLHCDPTASHYIKIVMDSVFGKNNYRNEIIWGYEKPRAAKKMWRRNHDTIFFYSKSKKWNFNTQRVPLMDGTFIERKPFKRPDGSIWHPKGKGKTAGSWWYDIASFATRMSSKERTGYPTQKPLKLLKRIIKASSNEGDIVLDPFCGCATACLAAEQWKRKWIGIDISPLARKLVKLRFEKELDLLNPDIIEREDIPKRDDMSALVKYNAPENKRLLYGTQHGNCTGCEVHFEYRNMTVDHIISQGKGGGDHIDNLQLLCQACNSSKGKYKTMPELKARLKQQGII